MQTLQQIFEDKVFIEIDSKDSVTSRIAGCIVKAHNRTKMDIDLLYEEFISLFNSIKEITDLPFVLKVEAGMAVKRSDNFQVFYSKTGVYFTNKYF